MNNLIKVTEKNGEQLVSARGLHEFLEINSRFNDWIRNRIEKYDFEEHQDFTCVTKNLVSGGRETDFILKIDMAKELSMVENNEQGKKARKYFITCEKKLKEVIPQLSEIEMIIKIANNSLAQDKKLIEIETKIDSVIDTVTLESNKQRKIQLAVSKRVFHLLEEEYCNTTPIHPDNQPDYDSYLESRKRELFSGIHRELKRKFGVASYKDIKVIEYEKALSFIENWIEDVI